MSMTQPNGDAVPDFSRVGYRWGDKEIPDYKVVKVLEAPEDGEDATALIQDAIDGMRKKGTILLKDGVYNVSGTIHMNKDYVILRGESKAAVINATGTEKRPLIMLGDKNKVVNGRKRSPIIASYTPMGQMYVEVEHPEMYAIGDRVRVCYFVNDAWIHDIKMDQIPMSKSGNTKQWEAAGFKFTWERIVTDIADDKIYFDNPIVQGLDPKYGEAFLIDCSCIRTVESGLENLTLRTEFDSTVVAYRKWGPKTKEPYFSDENHAWTAVDVYSAEHCWLKDIDSYHFGFGLVNLRGGAKNITVESCNCYAPVCEIRGSRRYAFEVMGGELGLFRNCTCEYDRHGFVTGVRSPGPTVFLDCTLTNAEQEVGPHLKWANGFLYDNVVTDGQIAVQDGTNGGSGHGWRGANFILWNCKAETIICQSPWVSAKNYAVGCVGKRLLGTDYKENLGHPQGIWISEGKHVEPRSLYLYQLEERKKNKIKVIR